MKMLMKLPFLISLICLLRLTSLGQNTNSVDEKYLIVLDIQEYYTSIQLSASSTQKLMDSTNYVINRFKNNSVIYIKSVHKVLNLSLSWPFIYVSIDSSAMHFDKRMIVVNEQLFIKEKPSAFTVKELNDFLNQNNAREIVIIGLMAEECIYASLMGGKELGYDMYVIPEAIVGKKQKTKDRTIRKLTEKGIKTLAINTIQKDNE